MDKRLVEIHEIMFDVLIENIKSEDANEKHDRAWRNILDFFGVTEDEFLEYLENKISEEN